MIEAAPLVAPAPGAEPHRREDRLWSSLARPVRRPQPLRGFDQFGDTVIGSVARWRAGRNERRRAARILTRARALRDLVDAELDGVIESARHRAVLARDLPASIDEAFAVCHEVVRRTVGLDLYEEQVLGALCMARGCLAEMATGEGKTVTAILPAALDGWAGRGCHVVTVNDYLARRDAEITGPAYARLGLTVGVVQDGSTAEERRRAYAAAITYAADKQVIFDFLRDRLVSPLQPRLVGMLLDRVASSPSARGTSWGEIVVQRGLHAAIVDEADSVLVDDALTPAIIATESRAGADAGVFARAIQIARDLRQAEHYTLDLREHRVKLTDRGRDRLASLAADLPPFWSGPRRREEIIRQALTALHLFHRGDEYIVRDGQVVIVDRSTGRILEGRQWQLGLHQAVEAKEGLEVTGERRSSAQISYQKFFQRYARLSGMTGTAWEVRREMWRTYHLPVVRVPTHRPVIRREHRDTVLLDEASKFEAVARRVEALHAEGRPVLVGTRSVDASERLGAMLAERGIACRILNATREAEEASIVADAGQRAAVTVATNMAGRGTDIILGPGVRELGGLALIATERHDERRVDRQLFGRAGRQGDPGLAQAFVSLDDSLIQRHGPRPLVRLLRAGVGRVPIVRAPLERLIWLVAQRVASRRAAIARAETAKIDAWIDLALHGETR